MTPTSETRILFVGDMHLGRQPGSVPDFLLTDHGLTARDLGPATAWERVVEHAINRRVHAVALAGDLVHRLNALHEAYGLLETGISKLTDAGITVCAVAGNHDFDTLPRLAKLTDKFILLGPADTWSSHLINGDGDSEVRLVGWSFPATHFPQSPLHQKPPAAEVGLITLGLLHADRDVGRSPYAPVASADLTACNYQGWFLGHIHLPDPVTDLPAPIYLGSVTGLDPTETGLHGPLLVTVTSADKLSCERLALAPLRWEALAVPVTDYEQPAQDLSTAILAAMTQLAAKLQTELAHTRALGVRLTLTGAVDRPAVLHRASEQLDLRELVVPLDGTALFVQKISSHIRGTYQLPIPARQDDPVGLLARQLLALANPTDTIAGVPDPAALAATLLAAARRSLAAVDQSGSFQALVTDDDPLLDDEQLTVYLQRAGLQALDHLLADTEGSHASD